MITRRIGKLLRGKATPFQVFSAGILGALIGFAPGFFQAPGLVLFWFIILAVLNANLFVAAIVGAGAKILALLLTPVSFAVGRLLLDGPTEGIFRAVVNAPVLAFFGFDYYLVVGSQFVGIIVGVLAGFAVSRLLTGFRAQMSRMEVGSERYQKWTAKKSVKIMTFIFVGGAMKKSYEELMAKKVGNPIRPIGVIMVVLLVVVIVISLQFFQGPIVTAALRSGLERANGATVDVGEANLEPTEGRLTVTGLAMANPNLLEEDVFRADQVEADLSLSDILRKRVTFDRVVIDNASNGELRKVKGSRIGPRPKPDKKEPSIPDMKDLDQILDNAKVWKERLAQAKKWLDSLGGSGSDEAAEPGSPGYREQLEARIRSLGYAHVRALHLVEGSPTVLVRKLEVPKLKTKQMPEEMLSLEGTNLSTHPNLVPEAPEIRIASSGGTLKVDLVMGSAAGGTGNQLEFIYRNLPVDALAQHLTVGGTTPVSGGTMDIAMSGVLSDTDSNLPVSLTLNDTNLSVGGSVVPVSSLTIPVAVRGPMDNPMIKADTSALQSALLDAGKKEAVNRLQGEAAKQLGIESEESDGTLEDTAGKLLGGFLKKQSEPEKKDDDGG